MLLNGTNGPMFRVAPKIQHERMERIGGRRHRSGHAASTWAQRLAIDDTGRGFMVTGDPATARPGAQPHRTAIQVRGDIARLN